MGLNNIVKSRGFKNFMAKLYGWGASVVIVGALFKITHIPGANEMLFLGLGTEAIIFFFSAFEPPHVEPDWSLVYPELAGMYHGISAETDELETSGSLSEELDKMLDEAQIDQSLINSLGQGLKHLSDNTAKLSDMTDAGVVTEEYITNVKSASSSVGELSNAYQKTTETLNNDVSAADGIFENLNAAAASASGLSKVYDEAAESIKSDIGVTSEFANTVKKATDSANVLAENYANSAEILSQSATALDFSSLEGNKYNEQLQQISQNLAALNAMYEVQLKDSNEQSEANRKVKETLDTFLLNLNESVENTIKYKDEVDVLAKKVSALNQVYGNMLTAMNANPTNA
jgi:gliding motility-associated protein GldL